MKLRHLGDLVALADERNFHKAARASHIAQPTLSAVLRQLKAEFGAPLVRRSNQRFEGFTDEGLRILEWRREIKRRTIEQRRRQHFNAAA